MKKIININLAGRVIPIEDAAYDALQRYIESLRRYFAAEEGRDEIINDIESRISELMNDIIRKGAAAVTEADIQGIIASMGRVEDFEASEASDAAAEGTAAGAGYTQSAAAKGPKGRLYRDSSDKLLGGVCSGLAAYLNMDPAIVRLLFAIITFGGFGFGVFLYILAWIILPSKALPSNGGKRLFRNPEDRVIAGVAGGLGAYFRWDPKIVRLVFAAPLILSIILSVIDGLFLPGDHDIFPNLIFSSFFGTFFIIYVVLWIVLPEARSPYEKMEMRGETVDVNRIRQNVQEGMTDFGARAKAWGEEVTERSRAFASEAKPVASGLGRAIGILFKAFFLFIFGTLAFGLFVVLLVFITGGIAQPFTGFLIDGTWQKLSLWGTLIFFLAVPLIALITWFVRRLMKVRSQNRYLGWTFGGLWTLGWISLFIFISTLVRDFRYSARTTAPVAIQQPGDRMTVRIDEPGLRYTGSFEWLNDNNDDIHGWDLTEDTLFLSQVKLRVSKSTDSIYRVSIIRYSQGENRREAEARANAVTYTVRSLDSALILGSGYAVSRDAKYRGQRVVVDIAVPVGKRLRFDASVEEKLDDTHVRVRWNGRTRSDWDSDWDDDTYLDWRPNVDYVMTESGELVDPTAPVTQAPSGVYEYNSDSADRSADRVTDSIDRLIEERSRQIEEDTRRYEERRREELRELEERARQRERRTTRNRLAPRSIPADETPMPVPFFTVLI